MRTTWTLGDLAELSYLSIVISIEEKYCISCKVIKKEEGCDLCSPCLDAAFDLSAEIIEEQRRVERGLYG